MANAIPDEMYIVVDLDSLLYILKDTTAEVRPRLVRKIISRKLFSGFSYTHSAGRAEPSQ